MGKLKSLCSVSGVILGVAIVAFFGIKGCIFTLWTYPGEVSSYTVLGEDQRSLGMIFLPSKRTILWYSDPNSGAIEAILTRMRGNYGTHYISNLWRVQGPGTFLGLRWYPAGIEPVLMEIETLQKYRSGPGEPVFPRVDQTTYSELLFKKGAVKFQNMWLEESLTDRERIDFFLSKMKQPQARAQ